MGDKNPKKMKKKKKTLEKMTTEAIIAAEPELIKKAKKQK